MPSDLLDGNVWVAAAFAAHPAHHSAQAVLLQALPQVDLAAFAISSSTWMVTLDRDFRQFLGAGFDLELLQADSNGGS
ncbi:hypothetical protein [Cyanobium gracile]|uniref:PIN domain-containing protein n=1 Tax=Cyanobium gracile UHCC 0281 TaxID=3110309 RepID=A0ABU5SWD0_9CYAN|nr:hypothetical protein [Cyanobium gracile]MEA5442804.1 hypothetical protein [Cyanobium gracile UHCC 0281]